MTAAALLISWIVSVYFVPYLGARNKTNTMVNGADTLSTVTAIDSNSMRFDWKAFN